MESARKLTTKNDIYGYTWTEIARVMNIDEATVRDHYNRAARKLKRNREYKEVCENHKEYRSDRDKFNSRPIKKGEL